MENEEESEIRLSAPFGPTTPQRYTLLKAFAQTDAYKAHESDDRNVEADIDYLDLQAGQYGLKFVAGSDGYHLEPMTDEERAAFQEVRRKARETVTRLMAILEREGEFHG